MTSIWIGALPWHRLGGRIRRAQTSCHRKRVRCETGISTTYPLHVKDSGFGQNTQIHMRLGPGTHDVSPHLLLHAPTRDARPCTHAVIACYLSWLVEALLAVP